MLASTPTIGGSTAATPVVGNTVLVSSTVNGGIGVTHASGIAAGNAATPGISGGMIASGTHAGSGTVGNVATVGAHAGSGTVGNTATAGAAGGVSGAGATSIVVRVIERCTKSGLDQNKAASTAADTLDELMPRKLATVKAFLDAPSFRSFQFGTSKNVLVQKFEQIMDVGPRVLSHKTHYDAITDDSRSAELFLKMTTFDGAKFDQTVAEFEKAFEAVKDTKAFVRLTDTQLADGYANVKMDLEGRHRQLTAQIETASRACWFPCW